MSAQNATTQRDAEAVRGPVGLDAIVDFGLREKTDEPFVGRGEEYREAELQQIVGVAEQYRRHGFGLAQVEAGVDHDALSGNARGERPSGAITEELAHLTEEVVVVRVGIGHPRS